MLSGAGPVLTSSRTLHIPDRGRISRLGAGVDSSVKKASGTIGFRLGQAEASEVTAKPTAASSCRTRCEQHFAGGDESHGANGKLPVDPSC